VLRERLRALVRHQGSDGSVVRRVELRVVGRGRRSRVGVRARVIDRVAEELRGLTSLEPGFLVDRVIPVAGVVRFEASEPEFSGSGG